MAEQLGEIQRRVRMIDAELTRLATSTDPALQWVPAETLRMHLDMAAQDMRTYVAALGAAPNPPASLAELEADNARLREVVIPLITAAQAVVSYDGDDTKPPITDLLLVLEAAASRAHRTVGGQP